MTFDELKEKAHRLPLLPGVYLMHGKDGTVIYVGKAKALRNRVSQYFADLSSHSVKTRRMIASIDSFETIFASSELDALLLENTLIKKYKPKYNILLKDDKGYPFIRLDTGDYPRFSVASRREKDGARYFGPYGGRGTANAAIRLLSETFLIPNCSRRFPRDIGRERPCLRLQLKKCCGVCTGDLSKEDYDGILRQCVQVLEGKSEELEAALQTEMEQAAEALAFEEAAQLRDRIRSIQKLRQSRIAVVSGGADTDALAFALRGSRACVLRLSHPLKEPEVLADYLSQLREGKCSLLLPQRGEKRREVQLALDNAALELAEAEDMEQRTGRTLKQLQDLLGLKEPPRRMESYDISHTEGTDAVASMVVFVNGKPLKRDYKKFRIKTARGGDDYGAMTEVLGRRLDRALAGDESFLPLPDIFLIDGGQGQAAVAQAQLDARGIQIPLYGMVKDSHHRTRALITPQGQELGITATPPVFALIGRVQEEVHRFAIEYHRDEAFLPGGGPRPGGRPGKGPHAALRLHPRHPGRHSRGAGRCAARRRGPGPL